MKNLKYSIGFLLAVFCFLEGQTASSSSASGSGVHESSGRVSPDSSHDPLITPGQEALYFSLVLSNEAKEIVQSLMKSLSFSDKCKLRKNEANRYNSGCLIKNTDIWHLTLKSNLPEEIRLLDYKLNTKKNRIPDSNEKENLEKIINFVFPFMKKELNEIKQIGFNIEAFVPSFGWTTARRFGVMTWAPSPLSESSPLKNQIMEKFSGAPHTSLYVCSTKILEKVHESQRSISFANAPFTEPDMGACLYENINNVNLKYNVDGPLQSPHGGFKVENTHPIFFEKLCVQLHQERIACAKARDHKSLQGPHDDQVDIYISKKLRNVLNRNGLPHDLYKPLEEIDNSNVPELK